MKIWIYVITILLFSACRPCDTITIDNGAIPDSVLRYVPYINGDTYSFRHSNGLIINFNTTRTTQKDVTYCRGCCKYEHIFEVNYTTLVPDYPIFNFQFQINNQDTLNLHCYASIGKYSFCIPTNREFDSGQFEKIDSVKIDSIYYYQVFKLKSIYNDDYGRDSIYVDSMYYNYEKGIIKILLSNGENYTIYE